MNLKAHSGCCLRVYIYLDTRHVFLLDSVTVTLQCTEAISIKENDI